MFIHLANTIILLFALNIPHNHYVSIANVNLNNKSNKIEISIEFTAHDFEKQISDDYNVNLKLGSNKEIANTNSILIDYISKNLTFHTNKNYIDLNLIGKEVNNDETMFLFLEGSIPKNIKELRVVNKLLLGSFNQQQNILHLDGIIQESFTFSNKNKTKTFFLEK